jgi:hypothetical protein
MSCEFFLQVYNELCVHFYCGCTEYNYYLSYSLDSLQKMKVADVL